MHSAETNQKINYTVDQKNIDTVFKRKEDKKLLNAETQESPQAEENAEILNPIDQAERMSEIWARIAVSGIPTDKVRDVLKSQLDGYHLNDEEKKNVLLSFEENIVVLSREARIKNQYGELIANAAQQVIAEEAEYDVVRQKLEERFRDEGLTDQAIKRQLKYFRQEVTDLSRTSLTEEPAEPKERVKKIDMFLKKATLIVQVIPTIIAEIFSTNDEAEQDKKFNEWQRKLGEIATEEGFLPANKQGKGGEDFNEISEVFIEMVNAHDKKGNSETATFTDFKAVLDKIKKKVGVNSPNVFKETVETPVVSDTKVS